MVTIDRERLISEKQNNKASPTGARLPREVMLLRDIFKFTKPSLDAFRPFGLTSRACQRPKGLPNSINVDYYIVCSDKKTYFFCCSVQKEARFIGPFVQRKFVLL